MANTLLGPDGKPFKKEVLTKEHASPTATGVRSAWSESITSGMDPAKLASILKAADEGNNVEFLKLAEEMEERDPHYFSVLSQRKNAVSGIEPIVSAAEDVEDQITEAVEALVNAPEFADTVFDLLDGLSKGYAVVEIDWVFGENLWVPKAYDFRDPRFFQFDKITGRELRIREDGNDEGKEINDYTMIIHRPK